MNGSQKKNVYIIQFNTPSSRNLMPLSAGLLYSYAATNPQILENYNFEIEIMRQSPEVAVRAFKDPYILAFSAYFWNFNQSVLVAKEAKKQFPNALIIFGGPSAPLHKEDTIKFFKEHPYVDVTVAGEGEVVFADILLGLNEGKPIDSIPGISYRDQNGEPVFQEKRDYIKDVSTLPSPFLNGVFDDLLKRYGQYMTGVVWETNRGCPFTCSFCFWGGPDSKISQFSMERVYAELDWIAKNKMAYIFGADANFGILKRDLEIASYMAKLNRETGYPKFFVINWTKNSTDKIFEIVDVLKESDIKFMMTTSVQSHNPDTLKAIKRQNIRLESFNKILEEASRRNFHTYSELILGLPLETYKTFTDGVRKVLSDNIFYHFNIYQCVLIPGTEMSEPEYVAQYGIQTRRCIMNLGKTVHEGDAIPEFEDIVVGTNTMPIADWRRSHAFGYLTKALYGFRMAFFLMNYLRREYGVDPVTFLEFIIEQAAGNAKYPNISYALKILNDLQDSILSGSGNETVRLPGVATSLHPETGALVGLLSNKESLYNELDQIVDAYCAKNGIQINQESYCEIMAYQFAMVPSWNNPNKHQLNFKFNVHQYFTDRVPLQKEETNLIIGDGNTFKNIDEFLQKQIYGGMVFSLLKASPLDQPQPVEEAQKFFIEFRRKNRGATSPKHLETTGSTTSSYA